MLEEPRSQPVTRVGPLDQPGNVRDGEARGAPVIDDAQARDEGRERIVGDDGPGGGDSGDECRFSDVGKSDQPDVRDELQFEEKLFFLSRPARFEFAGGLVRGRRVGGVSAAAFAALGREIRLAGLQEIEENRLLPRFPDDRPDRNPQVQVFAPLPLATAAFAGPSVLGFVDRMEAKERQ